MSDNQGGYECHFIEKPLQAIQSECPVCLLVLREPNQVNCCGYGFCRLCIEKVKADKKPCPCCNAKDFVQFEDKRLKRSLDAFRVHCSNKKQGCQWEGELGQLDNHLNYNPPEEKRLEGCQYSQIQCLHCSELFLRSNVQVHQSDQCQRRPFSCQYCNDYDSYYEDVTTNHWPVCGCYPLECSNKCGQILERQHLEGHISKDCLLTVVDCDFQHVGCEVRLPRKDIPVHLVESVVCHLSLQAVMFNDAVAKMKKENEKVKRQMARMEEENNELKKKVEKLTKDIQVQRHYTTVCPVDIPMTNFSKQKRENTEWKSSPFYTHLTGYKLCLAVNANGFGVHKNTYLITYLVLMRGEFDDQLKWPFRGKFQIKLINQDQDEEHLVEIIGFSAVEGERVTHREYMLNSSCWFIDHKTLQPRYLKNDCLKFRILFTGT